MPKGNQTQLHNSKVVVNILNGIQKKSRPEISAACTEFLTCTCAILTSLPKTVFINIKQEV